MLRKAKCLAEVKISPPRINAPCFVKISINALGVYSKHYGISWPDYFVERIFIAYLILSFIFCVQSFNEIIHYQGIKTFLGFWTYFRNCFFNCFVSYMCKKYVHTHELNFIFCGYYNSVSVFPST